MIIIIIIIIIWIDFTHTGPFYMRKEVLRLSVCFIEHQPHSAKSVLSKRKEFPLKRSKFFPFRVGPF